MKAIGFRRGLYRLARLGLRQKLYDDPEVQVRLAALEQFREMNQTYGIPVREAAELIGVPLANLYRWRKRYRANRIGGLRSRSQRPRRPRTRPWAKRGWGGLVETVGQVVQIDTMTVKPHYGFAFKQFTAVDVAGRHLVGELYSRATATCAARFLEQVLSRMPFPVQAIQVDGGGEFCAEFEQACQKRQIPLIVLPPQSPKMNSRVEYVHGTCRREFYECTEMAADLEGARRQWAGWEDTYNRVRPHEGLGLKTPVQYISSRSSSRACSQMP